MNAWISRVWIPAASIVRTTSSRTCSGRIGRGSGLLRYLAATGQILPVSDGSALGAERVSAVALAAVRQAVELAATRAPELGGLWIIAALLGHASPAVSVSYYLNSLE